MAELLVYQLLDLQFSFYSFPSNGPQLSWARGLPPARSGPGTLRLNTPGDNSWYFSGPTDRGGGVDVQQLSGGR